MKYLFRACIALLFVCLSWAPASAETHADSVLWTFADLTQIGGAAAHVEGAPRHILTPAGPAVLFNGRDDAIFVDSHPLAGAKSWTFEAIFRPDGGAFAQRWFHLAETDPKTGAESGARFLFEIRVAGRAWYLDTFIKGAGAKGQGYSQALIVPEKKFPLGRWYHVAQTYDGHVYRSYVNGVLQAEAKVAFKPQGAGHSSIGARINRVDYFHGAILNARFTRHALSPDRFEKLPSELDASENSPAGPPQN